MTLSVATTSEHSAAGSIEVIPTGAALGAEVRGIDLRRLDEAAFARVVNVSAGRPDAAGRGRR